MAWWRKSFRKRSGWWRRSEAKQMQSHTRSGREREAVESEGMAYTNDPDWFDWCPDEVEDPDDMLSLEELIALEDISDEEIRRSSEMRNRPWDPSGPYDAGL